MLLSTAATLALCGTAPAAAQTATGFSVGIDVADYSYRERDAGTTIVFDDGVMTGLDIGYTGRLSEDLFIAVRAAGRYGQIDYRDDTGDRIGNVDQSVGQLDLHLIKDIRLSPGSTLSPFVGLGVRNLEDESGGRTATSGAAGYDREVEFFYLPVGTKLSLGRAANHNVTLSAEYDFMLRNRVRTELSDADPTLPDFTLKGRGGHGVQLSATLVRPVGRRILSMGPFLRHWDVARSRSITFTDPAGSVTFLEPKNRTTEWGFRVGFTF